MPGICRNRSLLGSLAGIYFDSGGSDRRLAKGLGSALMMATLVSLLLTAESSEIVSKPKFVYSRDCRARDSDSVPVKIMQRELPDFEWDCDLGKLHLDILPYHRGWDVRNLCFSDHRARATFSCDSPSMDFVKGYLSVVCSEFEQPTDDAW